MERTDHRATIQRMIDYIEKHLESSMTLEQLSREAAMSSFHFSRVFEIYTGLPPITYVRRRRMFHAAHQIALGKRIIDVAIDFGYSNHGAFSRVFKGTMGMSPRLCRTQRSFKIPPVLTVRTQRIAKEETHMIVYETESICLRTFTDDDWASIQRLAIDKERSPFAHYDHAWPTSEEECKAMAKHFSDSDSFWAVCKKDPPDLVGVVVYNQPIADRTLDLGHLFRTDCMDTGFVKEALQRMIQYGFDELDVDRIVTHNAAAWTEQIEPLLKLGFRKTDESMGSFASRPNGEPIEFLGYTLEVNRSEWETAATA